MVPGHAEAIKPALRNLVENAIRVSPRTAAVTIAVEPGPRLTVSDTGAAIAPDRLAALFERVVQGDRGTSGRAGQRLAITRRSTDLHGGSLEAASAEAKGFSFALIFSP